MSNKICKLCLKEIDGAHNRRQYHPDCASLQRKETQKKWWLNKKTSVFTIKEIKAELDNLKEIIKNG